MYQLWLPALPLRPYIDNYWSLRADLPATSPLHEQIVVDGRADLILNFGDPYLRSDRDGQPVAMRRSNLDAQRGYPVSIAQAGSVHLIGVRFRPGGLAPFVRPPLHELSDNVLDISDALGRTGAELEARLYDCSGRAAEQVTVIDQFFLARWQVAAAHEVVLHTAAQIARQHGTVGIRALSTAMGYSVRSLDRLFRQYMGFSPKQYARIARLQHVLSLFTRHPTLTFAELALACGYYDQAHFNREFRAMTGQTPSEYRRHLLARREEPPPNLVQFLQETSSQNR